MKYRITLRFKKTVSYTLASLHKIREEDIVLFTVRAVLSLSRQVV